MTATAPKRCPSAACKGAGKVPDQQLSPHFRLSELLDSGTGRSKGIPNEPTAEIIANLKLLCEQALEPIRAAVGPLKINSGFRGLSVNTAIGGSKNSQHMKGEAADFVVPGHGLEDVFRWIVTESEIVFGQAILEGRTPTPTWIHLSLGAPYRSASSSGQVLRFDGRRYTKWTP